MTFRARAKYRRVALIELAAAHEQGGTLQVGSIASRQGFPSRYREQKLRDLRPCGILRRIRGPRDGYQLARATVLAGATLQQLLEARHAHRQPAPMFYI